MGELYMARILTLPTVGSEFTLLIGTERRKVAAVNSFAVTEAEPTTTETPTFDGPIAVTEAPGLPTVDVGVAAILPHTPMSIELRKLYTDSLVGNFQHEVPGAEEVDGGAVMLAVDAAGAATWSGTAAVVTAFRAGINDDVYAQSMIADIGGALRQIRSITNAVTGTLGDFVFEAGTAVAAGNVKFGTAKLTWGFTAKVTGPGSLNQQAGAAATTSLRLQPQSQWANPVVASFT